MKNLASSIWAVTVLTAGSVNTAFPDNPSEDASWVKRGKIMDWRGKESKHSDTEARRLLRSNSHVFAYVPADIRSAGEPSLRCDKSGIRTQSLSGYCIDYDSDAERTSWKIRYESVGRIDRVFKYAGYKNRYSPLDLWVAFNIAPSSPDGSVLFVSPPAKQTFSRQRR